MIDFQRTCRVCDALCDGMDPCEKHEIILNGRIVVVSGNIKSSFKKTARQNRQKISKQIYALNIKIEKALKKSQKLKEKLLRIQ